MTKEDSNKRNEWEILENNKLRDKKAGKSSEDIINPINNTGDKKKDEYYGYGTEDDNTHTGGIGTTHSEEGKTYNPNEDPSESSEAMDRAYSGQVANNEITETKKEVEKKKDKSKK